MKTTMRRWNQRLAGERGITGMETAIILIAFVVVASVFAFAVLSTGLFTSDKSKETIQSGLSKTRGTLETKGPVRAAASSAAVTSAAVGTGDGGTTAFPIPHNPLVPGLETVSLAGAVQTRGTDYSISYDTGVITFNVAPALASSITADYTWYKVDSVTAALTLSVGGQPVDLTGGVTIVGYQDDNNVDPNIIDYQLTPMANADGDNILEPGEIIEMTVTTCRDGNTDGDCMDAGELNYGLTTNDTFTITVKTNAGAVLVLERSIVSNVVPIMNLG